MATIPTCRETRGARWKQWKLYKYEKPARPQMRRSTVRLIGHTPHRKRACTHDLTKRKTTIYPSPLMEPYRHSRVGGEPQGGCVVAVPVIADLIRNPEGGGRVTRMNKTTPTIYPSPLMGEESKVRVKSTRPPM